MAAGVGVLAGILVGLPLALTGASADRTGSGRRPRGRVYDPKDPVVDRAYTDAELEAAIAAIADPERLRDAQDLVARSAPSLQRVLATALEEGGWFDSAPQPGRPGGDRTATTSTERVRAVQTMLAEETRLGMLVGVAVGFELARELDRERGRIANDRGGLRRDGCALSGPRLL